MVLLLLFLLTLTLDLLLPMENFTSGKAADEPLGCWPKAIGPEAKGGALGIEEAPESNAEGLALGTIVTEEALGGPKEKGAALAVAVGAAPVPKPPKKEAAVAVAGLAVAIGLLVPNATVLDPNAGCEGAAALPKTTAGTLSGGTRCAKRPDGAATAGAALAVDMLLPKALGPKAKGAAVAAVDGGAPIPKTLALVKVGGTAAAAVTVVVVKGLTAVGLLAPKVRGRDSDVAAV
jgi:hypothetical protein